MPRKTRDRRKRMSPPASLTVLGAGMLAFPFVLYGLMAVRFQHSFFDPSFLWDWARVPRILLLLGPLVVSLGLLQGKKWGWWAFLTYALLLTVHNTTQLILDPGAFLFTTLLLGLLFLSAIVYFLRRDISAPYFKMYPRGWRLQPRRPVRMPVRINDRPVTTTDFSPAGLYVLMKDPTFELNEAVTVAFSIGDQAYELPGGVARIDPKGAGFAFRRLSRGDRKRLETQIAEAFGS